jgi:hypothetical protein
MHAHHDQTVLRNDLFLLFGIDLRIHFSLMKFKVNLDCQEESLEAQIQRTMHLAHDQKHPLEG